MSTLRGSRLDNNVTKRLFLGPVVGRTNQYRSRSRSGTEVALRLSTVLETCKLDGVDPASHLHTALIAHDCGKLVLPGNFANASM